MKTKQALLALALVAVVTAGVAQTKRNRPGRDFMRDKLQLSQQILEGLATENFDLISAKATRLSAMSKEVDWRVFENPDYDQQSAIFRRHVDTLAKAAREKNLDAATLAYVRITMSCVDCHKLVRGQLVTSAERPAGPVRLAFGQRSATTRLVATSADQEFLPLSPPTYNRWAPVRPAQTWRPL